jgi:uncharacterized protein
MDVVISGASGLIGSALTTSLAAHGHRPIALVRPGGKGAPAGAAGTIDWDPAQGRIDRTALDGVDAVVHLAGAGIGDKRWTDDYKRTLLASRLDTTSTLAGAIAQLDRKPSVFLSGSAIGVYGAAGDEVLTEASPAGRGFLADICVQWEAAAQPAIDAGIRTAFLRTGIVLSPKGGALAKQLPIFKLGLGGKFGNGRQYQSWVTIADEVAAIEHLLTADVRGPVNLTAPGPVTQASFAKTLGKVLKRPVFAPVPRFAPALLLGGELADNLLFTGQRVTPTVLPSSGFTFSHPELEGALRSLLGR